MNEEEKINQPTSDNQPSTEENKTVAESLIDNNQPTTNMEVHHPHHVTHKKKFGEYLLEFFMLFLAVFLGFVAENIREQQVDKAREKEYIISMIEDAKTDTANIHTAINLNLERVLQLDTLAGLCFNYDEKHDSAIYIQYRFALVRPDIVNAIERTLSQLKNSGGIRLIKKKAAVDSIIVYDALAREIANQQTNYQAALLKMNDRGLDIFNFQNYLRGASVGANFTEADKYNAARLLTRDKTVLIGFANSVVTFKGVISEYIFELKNMDHHAGGLISTLKKQYHLENE